MHKMLVVAVREYNATVRTKAFLIGLVLTPLLMGGSFLIQKLMEGKQDTKERHFAIIDRTPGAKLAAVLDARVNRRNSEVFDPQTGMQVRPQFTIERVEPGPDLSLQRFELSERVRRKEIMGFLEIGPDVDTPVSVDPFSPGAGSQEKKTGAARQMRTEALSLVPDQRKVRYQSNSPTYDAFHSWAQTIIDEEVQQRRSVSAKVNHEEVKAVVKPVPLTHRGLSQKNPRTGEIEDGREVSFLTALLVPFGILMLMFMMVMSAAPLMQSVVEEKMQRIAEVLLGSIRPFELMLGKLVGMVGVTLTLAAVYLGTAYWAAQEYQFAEFLTPGVVAWFLAYQVLAVLMYGSLFIAIGAACTETKETQTLLMPVMLLACVPLFMWINIVREPDGALATGISFFPFATPMVMIARLAIPPGIPLWQPIAGVGVVLATTLLCVYVAGRIFRVGLLMQGKGAKVSEMVKWVFRG